MLAFRFTVIPAQAGISFETYANGKSDGKKGFSLVELSIVLVILGLLTGGILAGQSLIRAAELRALTQQITRYHSALYTFRDKYMAFPGDMRNATDFWGIAAGTTDYDATCEAVYASTPATCNGNGDGIIRSSSITNAEIFRAWQHLANAGLVEGSYTGRNETNDHSNPTYVAGKNVPFCKIGYCRFSIVGLPTDQADTSEYFAQPGRQNRLEIRPTGGNGILTPEEAWNIDTKLDDGQAMTGAFFISHKMTGTFAPNCVNSDDPATANYKLEEKVKRCAPSYRF